MTVRNEDCAEADPRPVDAYEFTALRATTLPLERTMLPALSSEPTLEPEAFDTAPFAETVYVPDPMRIVVREAARVPISVVGSTAPCARIEPFVPTILPWASTVPIRAPDVLVTFLEELIL